MPSAPFPLDLGSYLLSLLGAFGLGCAKAGLTGAELLNVLIQAELWGAKKSLGVVLVLLIVADLTVYPLYRKHGSWPAALGLLPSAVVGVIAGSFLLGSIDDQAAGRVIGLTILTMVILLLVRERFDQHLTKLVGHRLFSVMCGLLLGFATMVANAAGPVMAVFLLIRRVPKMDLIGISVRFFLCINLIKIPFSQQLDLISWQTLQMNLFLLPGLFLGIFLGRRLVKAISQHTFSRLLICFATIAALRLLLFPS